MFKVNNKSTTATSMTIIFNTFASVPIADFEQVYISWVYVDAALVLIRWKVILRKKVFLKYPTFRRKICMDEACNFIRKRLQQRCFPVKFEKSFKNIYFEEHL